MYLDVDKVADMVPVDLTVNAILATAWRTAADYKDNRTSEIPIYNFVSGARNPLTWYEFIDLNKKHSLDKPTTKAVWYYGLNLTNNYYLFLLYNFFLHYLPALLIDFFSGLFTKRRGMLQFYHKVIRLATVLFYFSTQDWKFSDDGVCQMWSSMTEHDRKVFPFNIADMSWDYYMETFLAGSFIHSTDKMVFTAVEPHSSQFNCSTKLSQLDLQHTALSQNYGCGVATFDVASRPVSKSFGGPLSLPLTRSSSIRCPIPSQEIGNALVTLPELRVSMGGGDQQLCGNSPTRLPLNYALKNNIKKLFYLRIGMNKISLSILT
ncbi:Putative fatty acyl-CoA reductase CG5065 [Eumeta japonica]|uniref:Fatty acyl-CoA reductase CG5065 n=1 Tax=Eumeta variegata TaxID=151549 RepID=A0A4C1YPG7_EUMVA|nr:Putative fatty acyl-CoA reductase CG5065 [Eumeta japonica]